jgi:hypothetical protein
MGSYQVQQDQYLVLSDRVGGLLVLLFAQRVTSIFELRIGDLCDIDGRLVMSSVPTRLRYPNPSSPRLALPGPALEHDHYEYRDRLPLPRGRPGCHITAAQLTKRLNRLGITRLER